MLAWCLTGDKPLSEAVAFYRGIYTPLSLNELTHWGRATHICDSKLAIIGSDNGLAPGRRHAIIWTDAGILLIGPLETNFSVILSKIHIFSFKKMHLKTSSVKWRPFCFGLNVLSQERVTIGTVCYISEAAAALAQCQSLLGSCASSSEGQTHVGYWPRLVNNNA